MTGTKKTPHKPAKAKPAKKTGEFEIFREEDFRSIEVILDFENVTTRTKLKASDKAIFSELAEDSFIIEVPEKACSKGHNVLVEITTKNAPEDLAFSVTGKVVSTEKVNAGKLRTEVKLVQYEESDWNAFTQIFSKRQEEITEFFDAVRGS